jgi:hypothetical protein
MQRARGWEAMREMSERLLKERTGEDVGAWSRRIRRDRFANKEMLRTWLEERGVTGYARSLLEWECFGYPEFLTTSAEKLIEGQYEDRPQLRPIFDTIIAAATSVGDVAIQARKTYVSLVSPRRTFARVQASAGTHVSLGLRLSRQKPGGRLQPSKIHETMPLEVRLESPDEVDAEVLEWLQRAYVENS